MTWKNSISDDYNIYFDKYDLVNRAEKDVNPKIQLHL
jgi:hypothetical protein